MLKKVDIVNLLNCSSFRTAASQSVVTVAPALHLVTVTALISELTRLTINRD